LDAWTRRLLGSKRLAARRRERARHVAQRNKQGTSHKPGTLRSTAPHRVGDNRSTGPNGEQTIHLPFEHAPEMYRARSDGGNLSFFSLKKI